MAQTKPGNVAISCPNNSIRPFRRIFENLSIPQMCKLESPQDYAIVYKVQQSDLGIESPREKTSKLDWTGIVITRKVRLATDTLNPLRVYCC